MQSIFIYYKVPIAREAELREAAATLMAVVQKATGIEGELLKRSDTKDGMQTWMEIYRDVADPEKFLATLAETARPTNLTALIAGERHIEMFEAA